MIISESIASISHESSRPHSRHRPDSSVPQIEDYVRRGIHGNLRFSARSASLGGRVAVRAGSNADATEQLLDACTALGLLRKRDGVYENHPVAATYLRAGSPHTLYGYVRYSDAALYPMWTNLADAVREGSHRWTQTFGLEGPIFSHFFRTDSAMRDFLRGHATASAG